MAAEPWYIKRKNSYQRRNKKLSVLASDRKRPDNAGTKVMASVTAQMEFVATILPVRQSLFSSCPS